MRKPRGTEGQRLSSWAEKAGGTDTAMAWGREQTNPNRKPQRSFPGAGDEPDAAAGKACRAAPEAGGGAPCPAIELEEPAKDVEIVCELGLSPGHFSSYGVSLLWFSHPD